MFLRSKFMPSPLEARYDAHYLPRLKSFASAVGEIGEVDLPELHLPLFGSNYETAKPKVVFIGRDTRGWWAKDRGGMANLLADVKEDAQTTLHKHKYEFDSFEFTEWTNNFGTSFWDTIFKILAGLHSIDDWKQQLKMRQSPEILRSFVWANTNSVEVTPPREGATYATWKRLKEASAVFDHLSLILDVFAPDIVIIMYWGVREGYLGCNLKWERIHDHLEYAWDSDHSVEIFKTAHPTWLSHKRLQPGIIKLITERCLTKAQSLGKPS